MKKEEVCCERFNPAPWEGKTITWKDKKFIKDRVFTLFYMPMNFGSVITRIMKQADDAKATISDGMALSDHTSLWNMDIYVAVDKEVEGAHNVTMSGSFVSKVYEGDFKETGVWMKDFDAYCMEKRIKPKKIYMWYTTCPACAKKYGKNYVVVFGQKET